MKQLRVVNPRAPKALDYRQSRLPLFQQESGKHTSKGQSRGYRDVDPSCEQDKGHPLGGNTEKRKKIFKQVAKIAKISGNRLFSGDFWS